MQWMRIYGDTCTVALSCLFPSPFQSLGVWWPCSFFFTPNNNNNNTVTAPAAQRFSLIHNAYIVMMMMNNDKHNTRTNTLWYHTLFFCCDYITRSRRVCFGFGWWDHSTCGYNVTYPGRPVSSRYILMTGHTLSLYVNDDIEWCQSSFSSHFLSLSVTCLDECRPRGYCVVITHPVKSSSLTKQLLKNGKEKENTLEL